MSLILPALAFLAIVIYELFSKEPEDDQSYPASLGGGSSYVKLPMRHTH